MNAIRFMDRLGAGSSGSPPDRRVRAGPRSGRQAIHTGHARLTLLAMFFALVFAVIGARLVDLAIADVAIAGGWTNLDHPSALGGRAEVVDRNGVLLAANVSVASLYADPRQVLDPPASARALAPLLPGIAYDELLKRLSSGRGFVWLQRHLTPRQHAEIHRLGMPGIGFRVEQRRVYPMGPLTAHAVGFADVDNHGLAGIEQGLDERLGNASGAVRLSLDVRVQHALRDELAAGRAEFDAIGAAGTVLDTTTGEILALVSLPDFDPNHAAESTADARFNRSTLGVYEPGSTLKIVTAAMALDYGTATLNEQFDATGPLRISRFTIRDTHPRNSWLTVPEIFVYSSNIGAARMAMEVGPERQRDFLDRLGMLERVSLELPEVAAPMQPPRWSETSGITIAYGHGIAVSQMQLASALATIVNGGTRVSPTLLAREEAARGEQVLAPETSGMLRALLRLNVLAGTGRGADALGFRVGGKTGTAEKSALGGYDRDSLISSFIAAFPMDAPRYAVLVLFDEPKGSEATAGLATAGWTAAPVTGRVVKRIAPLLGVAPEEGHDPAAAQAMLVSLGGGRKEGAAF